MYGRAKDTCSGVSDGQLTSFSVDGFIRGKIYQRDAIKVVSEA